jgi:hypothetical protein
LKDLIVKFFTSPLSERFRARIPYPIYISLPIVVLSALLGLPWVIGWFTHRLTDKDDALWIIPLMFMGAALLAILYHTIIAVRGRLSGYRPYIFRWNSMEPAEATFLMERLIRAATELRFQIVWQKENTGFIGVLGLELQRTSERYYAGDNFPVRLVFALSRGGSGTHTATLKLEVRTLVIQDSGETAHLRELGEWIVASATNQRIPPTHTLRHRAVNPQPDSETESYQKKFAPLAHKFRVQLFRMIAALLLCLFGVMPVAARFMPAWLMIPMWFALAILVMTRLAPEMPDCPRCGKNVASLYGPCCPDCGGNLVRNDKGPQCQSCGKTLRTGKRTNFRIRACTHCGTFLDSRGLGIIFRGKPNQ